MSPERDIRSDLQPDVPDDLVLLAARLDRQRPVPSAAFRGDLRRRLIATGATHRRPARLRMLIGGYASTGSFLLLVGAASVAGLGPLGA